MIAQLFEPWLITQPGFEVVMGIATRRAHFADAVDRALAARGGQPLENTRNVTMREGVAVIPIEGVLFRHAGAMEEMSGGVSYSTLRRDLESAMDSPDVNAILFHVASPGGEAAGCQELAHAIAATRGRKPSAAYIAGLGCSAAYWLASACEELVIAPSGMAGSIGAILAVFDDRDAQALSGERVIKFISSVSPNKDPDPRADEGAALYQARVDVLGRLFAQGAAANRGMTIEQIVEAGNAGWVRVGADAVTARLADRVGDFESTLAALAERGRHHGATMQIDQAKAQEQEALARLGTATLAAFKCATVDEAHGALTAAASALTEVGPLRVQLVTAQAVANRAELRATIEQGLSAGRLSLGELKTTLPHFVVDDARREALTASLDKIGDKEWTAPNVVGAVCAVDVTASEVARIKGWSERKAPNHPAVKAEPKRDAKAESKEDEALDAQSKVIADVGEKTRAHFRSKTITSGSAAK